jgi:hypothetical protein
MIAKDTAAIEEGRDENVLPIETVMYHDSKHHNKEAVDQIIPDRSAGQLGDGFDEKKDRRLMFKVDFRLIPMLGIIYGMSVIDRYRLKDFNSRVVSTSVKRKLQE